MFRFVEMTRTRLLVALVLVAVVPAAAVAQTFKAPKSGSQYTSDDSRMVVLTVSGKSIEIVAMTFPCKNTTGRTSLNDFPIKRTSRGYRFNADANGSITYGNGKPDQNGTVHISGRFAADAKTVRGHIRVKTRRCGDTGDLKWRAAR